MKQISPALRTQVLVFTAGRMIMNTAYRMVYPFITTFSRGLGVDISTIAMVLSVRSFTGALGPLVAPIADRRGRKVSMLLGLSLFLAGMLAVILWPGYPAFFAGMILNTLAIYIYLPALQAYLGDRVAYEQRGQTIGITELSWSLSFIIGVPLMGLLISRLGWSAAFPVLGLLGAVMIVALARMVPADPPHPTAAAQSFWHGFGLVLRSPTARFGLLLSLCMTCSNEMVNMIYGRWMEDSFGLQIAGLGAASMVLGLAELSGEGLTSLLVDRVGKQRSIAIGLVVCCLAALALPALSGSVWAAVGGLAVFYLGFEYALVSSIPLMTEVVPGARATLMAVNVAAFSIGRGIGDLAAPPLYNHGILACALAAIAVNLLALLALSQVKIKTE